MSDRSRQMQNDPFLSGYVACLLWSSNDETTESGGVPLDQNYGPDDFSEEAWKRIVKDCREFKESEVFKSLLVPGVCLKYKNDEETASLAGHDFWLTRNHHGAGFWDGDWEEEAGERATKVAQEFGELNPYVGDDGRLYF